MQNTLRCQEKSTKNGRKRLNFSGLCNKRLQTESRVHLLTADKRAAFFPITVRAIALLSASRMLLKRPAGFCAVSP